MKIKGDLAEKGHGKCAQKVHVLPILCSVLGAVPLLIYWAGHE